MRTYCPIKAVLHPKWEYYDLAVLIYTPDCHATMPLRYKNPQINKLVLLSNKQYTNINIRLTARKVNHMNMLMNMKKSQCSNTINGSVLLISCDNG